MSAPLLVVTATLLLGAPAARPLSADEAVARALASHPDLGARTARVREAEAERAAAYGLENPELRVRHRHPERLYSLLGKEPDDHPFDGGLLSLRWDPPPLASFGAAQAAVEREVDQRRADLDEARAELAALVRKLHAEARNLERQLALADDAVTLSTRLAELGAKRASAGLGTALEESLARLDLLESLTDLEELRSRHREVVHELFALIAVDPDEELELVAPPGGACRVPGLSDEELEARALSASPELRGARASVLEEEALLLGAWLANVPWPTYLEVNLVPGDRNEHDSIGFAFGLELPVIDWRLAEIERSSAERQRKAAEENAVRLAVATRARRALLELRSKARLVELYRAEEKALIDGSIERVEAALAAGQADATQAALVRARALKAKRDLLRAELGCELAAIDLARLLGEADRERASVLHETAQAK